MILTGTQSLSSTSVIFSWNFIATPLPPSLSVRHLILYVVSQNDFVL